MLRYSVTLTPDDNGTLLVTCHDLPEVTSFGDDREDALRHAADAIEEALAARIAAGEDIPIIAFSGRSMHHEQVSALRAGCDLHLTKPCAPDRLLDAIHKLLGDV